MRPAARDSAEATFDVFGRAHAIFWHEAGTEAARLAAVAEPTSMVDIVIVSKHSQRADAFAVRLAVFVDEQGIPRDEELDDLDAEAVHCVGYADGLPVAAGRLVLVSDDTAKVGRMAVLRAYRRRGFGAGILRALEQEGVRRGRRRFTLSAQENARDFYRAAGYVAQGGVYDEVGIPHIAMSKEL